MEPETRTWAEISLEALEHNYNQLRSKISDDCMFLAVIKANAYGHGAERVALRLQVLGADYFAVATLDEAIKLRECGIILPILILGYTPAEYANKLIEHELTQTVFSREYGIALAAQAEKAGGVVDIHIKIDSGMSRLGFSALDPTTPQAVAEVCSLSSFNPEGIFTHFSVAEEDDGEEYTMEQFDRFADILSILRDEYSTQFEIRHCANSAAMINYPCTHLDMVRVGIALYGAYPNPQNTEGIDLHPVMELKTRIIQIKNFPAGTSVSYGRTYTTDRAMRIAVIPIGYADGLMRLSSNNFIATLHGRQVKSVGRICMDMCMLDVTDVLNAKTGDEVTLFGAGRNISVEDYARAANTISYEVFCSLSERIPRIYPE